MQIIHRSATQTSTHPLIMHEAVFVAMIVLLFSMASTLYPQLHSTYAGTCIDYEPTENAINIMCNASFEDVIDTIEDPDILDDLGNGEYLLRANLQTIDGVTFEIDSDDGLQYLKIAGANGIIVNGKIEIRDVKITSWDPSTNKIIDQNINGTIGRGYIQFGASEGAQIINSEFAY